MKLLDHVRGRWETNFLRNEFWLSVVLSAAIFGVAEVVERDWFRVFQAKADWGAVYATLASVLGALLGFVITSMSILLAVGSSPALDRLRESRFYPQINQTFISTSKSFAVGAVASLVGLIYEESLLVLVAVAFLLVLCGLRLTRCLWILQKIIHLSHIKE